MSSSTEVMNPLATKWYKWKNVDWHNLERQTFKLQKRIYRASRGNDVSKLKSLQKLLLRSKGAKLLAVKRVTQENNGKNTA